MRWLIVLASAALAFPVEPLLAQTLTPGQPAETDKAGEAARTSIGPSPTMASASQPRANGVANGERASQAIAQSSAEERDANAVDPNVVAAETRRSLDDVTTRLAALERRHAGAWQTFWVYASIGGFLLLLLLAGPRLRARLPSRLGARKARLSGRLPNSAFLTAMGLPLKAQDDFESTLRESAITHSLRIDGQDFESRANRLLLALLKGVENLAERVAELEARSHAVERGAEANEPAWVIEDLRAQLENLRADVSRLGPAEGVVAPAEARAAPSAEPTATGPTDDQSPFPPSVFGGSPFAGNMVTSTPAIDDLEGPIRAFFRDLNMRTPGSELMRSLRSVGRAIAQEAQTARALEPLKQDERGQMIAAAFDQLSEALAKPGLGTSHQAACQALLDALPGYGLIWPAPRETLDPESHFKVQSDAAQGQQISLVVRPGLRRGDVVLMRALVRLAA